MVILKTFSLCGRDISAPRAFFVCLFFVLIFTHQKLYYTFLVTFKVINSFNEDVQLCNGGTDVNTVDSGWNAFCVIH